MREIDPITGLPKDLGVWENITKENLTIKVYLEKKKFKKYYTVIEGINEKDVDIKDIARKLKAQLACGGTVKEGKIELQGDHKSRMRDYLIKLGFASETIEIR